MRALMSGGRAQRFFKTVAVVTAFAFLSSFCLPIEATAARSRAGGGELAEMEVGKLLGSIGISMGTMIIGSALKAGLGSVWSGLSSASSIPAGDIVGAGSYIADSAGSMAEMLVDVSDTATSAGSFIAENSGSMAGFLSSIPDVSGPATNFSNSFGSLFNAGNLATKVVGGFTTFTATSQVNRAFTLAGQYHGWNPTTTYLLSNIAMSATASLLNPSPALGHTLDTSGFISNLQGLGVGVLGGALKAGAIVAIDGDKISKGQQIGPLAQIAGMAAGVFGTELGRYCFDNTVYTTSGPGNPVFGTLNQWPQIAVSSLGIAAQDVMGSQGNGIFIKDTVQGMFGPLLNSLAYNYRLTPESYGDENWETTMKNRYNVSGDESVITQVLKSQLTSLPGSLISMGVGAALDKVVKPKDPMQKMMVSLAGVTASGVISGVYKAATGKEGTDTATVLADSLGSSLTDWGSNTLAMGYPKGFDSVTWDNYTTQLYSYGKSAMKNGYAQTIANHSFDAAKSEIKENLSGVTNPIFGKTLESLGLYQDSKTDLQNKNKKTNLYQQITRYK